MASDFDFIPSISSGHVYNGQQVTITCTTERSQTLVWESDEYIGHGMNISIQSNDTAGRAITLNSNSNVIVYVLHTSDDRGNEMIYSQIHIFASLAYPNFTISCRNIDLNLEDSVTYYITGKLKLLN